MGALLFAAGIVIPLAYGGITDYRHRIIPNAVCVIVFAAGLFGAVLLPRDSGFFIPLWQRAAGIFPAALMLILAYFKNGIGGGDIKLMAALGFTIGYYALVPVLLITSVSAVTWAKIQKKKNVPLCSFVFIGVLAYAVLKLFI